MLKEFTKIQQTEQAIRGPQFNRDHGSLYDRGSADSYYGRVPEPHWWTEGTHRGEKVTDLNLLEIAEYMAGYQHNEQFGHKKDYS
jgi:hypothetical protein